MFLKHFEVVFTNISNFKIAKLSMYRFLGHQVFLTISQEINKRQDGVQSKQRANLKLLSRIRKLKFFNGTFYRIIDSLVLSAIISLIQIDVS